MIYFIVKGPGLIKINIMCKLYMFLFSSLSQGTHHCTFMLPSSVPWYCPDLGLFLHRSVWFLYVFLLDLICLTSMLKRIICNMAWAHLTVTQHVLIKMIFGIFAVSCTVHVRVITFLPHLQLNSIGLPWPAIEFFDKHSTPKSHGLFQVFEEKNKWQVKYFIFKRFEKTDVIASVFSFSIVDKQAKISALVPVRSEANQEAATRVAVVQFYRHCMRRERITDKGICHRKYLFFLVLIKRRIHLLYFC